VPIPDVPANFQLTQHVSRSEKLYQTLQEIVALVNSSLDSDRVLNEFLIQLQRILPYTCASLYLLQGNRLTYAAGRGLVGDGPSDLELSARDDPFFQSIATSKQAVLIKDVQGHPDWQAKPGLEHIRTWIGAPLVFKDRLIGYLSLGHHQAGAYAPEDMQLLDTLARQVATAIENARLYTETRRWAEEQATLNTIATAASTSLNLTRMLNYVLDAVRLLFGVDTVEVRLLDEGERGLQVIARQGQQRPPGFRPAPALSREPVNGTRQPDQALSTPDLRVVEGLGEGQAGAVAAVTLRTKERLLGSLAIISTTSRQFTSRDISLLEAIGYQLSLAIENARLYEQLKQSEARKTDLLLELEESLQRLQRAQAQLVQSEKMAAIGQLVSGVAHELNNPLTAIVGYAQILQATSLPALAQDDLEHILDQAQRSARIVQKLLTFGRQHKPERRLVDINQLIDETLDLVSHQLALDHIAVERRLGEGIPLALADPYQLQQVWLNLIQNAQQAMGDWRAGGLLRVVTLSTPDGRLRVEFSDNGPGIAPEVIDRVFDHFFTTKPVGKGTGLGLSICYGIVQEHQGQIWAENNPQGGCTFVVELPRGLDEGGQLDAEGSLPARGWAGARVLIVDDEDAILELTERLLTGEGCLVETARDGFEAMERISRQDFDVILLDLVLPRKGGVVTYREMVEARPELASRIIVATGDVASEATRAFLEETDARCITKPFDLVALSQVIQATLDQSRG